MSYHDKSKSGGGLLDMLIDQTKSKGILMDIQNLRNDIMKLTVDEVDQKFVEILEDNEIPKDKHQSLLKKSLNDKRDMLVLHLKAKSAPDHRYKFSNMNPLDYRQYIRDNEQHSAQEMIACLECLRLAMTSNPISWIKEFGHEGINEILSMLFDWKNRRGYDRIEYDSIRCFKAFVNNTWGLNLILTPAEHPVLNLLAKCLTPTKPQTMCEALRLLAGFCMVPDRDGYDKVLRAISVARPERLKSGERFRPIVDGLFIEYDNKDTKRDLCCMSLMFINTITYKPSDLNFRLHLRCEIMRMGLYDGLAKLGEIVNTSANENLVKHFKIFNEMREDDFEEFSQRFDNVRLEMDGMNVCFEVLKNLVVDTSAEPYLLSILQHLLYIRDDVYRPAYFQLIEECVTQIVLHKAGCDPNFENRDFHIDTAMLIDPFEKSEVEEYAKKLEELETARQEAEARVAKLEERLSTIKAASVIRTKTSKLPNKFSVGVRIGILFFLLLLNIL